MKPILLLSFVLSGAAPDALQEAAERYARNDAAGAVEAYESAIAEGANGANVYFNLGTAALRAGDIGTSVWALQEARARAPWDEDVLFNLELARRENQDRLVGLAEPVWMSVMHFIPRAALQWLSFALFLAFCGLLTARGALGPGRLLSRWTVRTGLFTLVLGLLTLAVELTAGAPTAVVIAKEAVVRSSARPDGPEAFRVHAGLTVRPVEDPHGGMVRIRLANGLEGYVAQEAIRRVQGPPSVGS